MKRYDLFLLCASLVGVLAVSSVASPKRHYVARFPHRVRSEVKLLRAQLQARDQQIIALRRKLAEVEKQSAVQAAQLGEYQRAFQVLAQVNKKLAEASAEQIKRISPERHKGTDHK